MSEPNQSPLPSLVLFMICLSIAGSAFAGAHYYAVDLPAQKALQAPENAKSNTDTCIICLHNCELHPDDYDCPSQCIDLHC